MKNSIAKNSRKALSVTDCLGFVWYAIICASMLHQGNLTRNGFVYLSVLVPMYAIPVVMLLVIVLRATLGKWKQVRMLYATTVTSVAVALAFGMTLNSSFMLAGGLPNALNLAFALHAVWRIGRCDNARDGYPVALSWLNKVAVYLALAMVVGQLAVFGVAYGAWIGKSGIVFSLFAVLIVLAVLLVACCLSKTELMKKMSACAYSGYAVLAVGAYLMVCYYLVPIDTAVHEDVCRAYMNFGEFGVNGFYPYDDMVVWRPFNLLVSAIALTAAFGEPRRA